MYTLPVNTGVHFVVHRFHMYNIDRSSSSKQRICSTVIDENHGIYHVHYKSAEAVATVQLARRERHNMMISTPVLRNLKSLSSLRQYTWAMKPPVISLAPKCALYCIDFPPNLCPFPLTKIPTRLNMSRPSARLSFATFVHDSLLFVRLTSGAFPVF